MGSRKSEDGMVQKKYAKKNPTKTGQGLSKIYKKIESYRFKNLLNLHKINTETCISRHIMITKRKS